MYESEASCTCIFRGYFACVWVLILLARRIVKCHLRRLNFFPLNIAAIGSINGMLGKENNGEYKITTPQNDLDVTVDGFKIISPTGLGSWAAFTLRKMGLC